MPTARIEDLLKEGQEVVVQVVKEPLGTKGARITSHLSLPGRFLSKIGCTLIRFGNAPFLNARSRYNPFVVCIDHFFKVLVGENPRCGAHSNSLDDSVSLKPQCLAPLKVSASLLDR